MDFTATTEQDDAAALARSILTDRCSQPRLGEVEAGGARFDADLWRALGASGLLGVAVPDSLGGAGFGLLEACSVAVEAGRAVAPLPLPWHTAATMALVEHGTSTQHQAWLADALAGRTVLTCAFDEDRSDVPVRPTTTAERDRTARDGEAWMLTGVKTVVPSGTVADGFVVPADTAEGGTVFLVRPDDPGVRVEAQTLNDGDTAARLDLSGVRLGADRVLGRSGRGTEVTGWTAQRLTALLCAAQLGVLEGALALTAGYARTREQFGRPIGTFQAVSQRLADGYIDLQGVRLTLWQAAWRLSEDLPARLEVATAKLWAADAGHRIAHTTVHVHGGVGIDLDGEAHRYFTAAKRLELMMGGATQQARAVGRALAAEPA